ncbi:MAG: TolC family protein [Phycisphaerales bacterium]|nr:TolC family protein [Phycisphaerales bacterium]
MQFRLFGNLKLVIGRMSVGCAAAAMSVAAGCATYEPAPVSLSSHQAEFLQRTPESALDARAAAARGTGAAQPSAAAPGEIGASGAAVASATEPPELDATDGLTLEESELVALVFNAELRRAREQAGVARAGAENAGLWDDPRIALQFTRILESVSDPNELFGSFSMTLPISGRLEIEKKRLGRAHAAALARVAQMEWMVRMDVRREWSRLAALSAQRDAMREFVSLLAGVVDVVEAMARDGEMAAIEARLFALERLGATAELHRLDAMCRESELEILRLLGLPPRTAAALLARGVAPRPIEGDGDDAALQRRVLNGPALLVAMAEYEVAESTLEEQVRTQYPDLQIGPGYGTQNTDRQVLVGISVPLPILNGNRRGIAESHAAREVARASAELALESAIAAVALRQAQWTAARRQREILELELIPLVELQYAQAREVARLGEVNTLALMEGLKRRNDARMRLIEAMRDETIASIDVEEILGPPEGPVAGDSP